MALPRSLGQIKEELLTSSFDDYSKFKIIPTTLNKIVSTFTQKENGLDTDKKGTHLKQFIKNVLHFVIVYIREISTHINICITSGKFTTKTNLKSPKELQTIITHINTVTGLTAGGSNMNYLTKPPLRPYKKMKKTESNRSKRRRMRRKNTAKRFR
jgi:hypothetical protein